MRLGLLERDRPCISQPVPPSVTGRPMRWRQGTSQSKATFNEPKYMSLNSHPHPYGVFIGGNDMGTPSQTELYCAASGNGKFIVCGFGPEPFRVNGLLGESNAAIHEAAGRGQPVTASYDKTALIGSGKLTSTNGYYGLASRITRTCSSSLLATSTN